MTVPVCCRSSIPWLAAILLLTVVGSRRCVSADETTKPQVEYTAIHAGTGGVNTYVPGKWGIVNLEVTNPLNVPHELLSTTFFTGHPTLQFGRRIWVPARSRLFTWQPVLVPDQTFQGTSHFEFQSLVLEPAPDREVATRDDTGRVLHSGILPAQLQSPITGMIASSVADGNRMEGFPDMAYELLVAARRCQRLSTRVTGLWDRNPVPDDESLQPLHQLVVADNRATEDPVALAAIRRWVHGGGRLWVMLDRVAPQFLERILGDEFQCAEVDRVGLTTVRVEATNKMPGGTTSEAEHEQPVELARVFVEGADTAYRVNGWPAAVWKNYGAGKVLVTTLAPEGWLRRPVPSDRRPTIDIGAFVPIAPLEELAREFLGQKEPAPKISQLLEPHAAGYIGYAILSRSLVGTLLGGFVAALTGLGIWLLRRGAVEHLGWLGPGTAVCVAAVLMAIGARNRHAIPATAAAVEFVESLPGTDDVRSRGTVVLYNPEAAAGVVGAGRGGRLIADMAGLEGTTKRMVWTDLGKWNWEHLSFNPGQRRAVWTEAETRSERSEARATFGPDGLAGRLAGPGLESAGDALIATPYGRMRVDLQAGGEFRVPRDAVFAREQYLASGLLSDEQNRRAHTYAQILPAQIRHDILVRPQLWYWTDPRDAGFRFDPTRRLAGASLVAVPLTIERPEPGTSIRISSPFLPFRNTFRPDGNPSSGLWDHHRLEWMQTSLRSDTWLRFQLPVELLPVELTRAQLVIQVTGPMGRLEISGYRRGLDADGAKPEVVSLKVWQDPVGALPALELIDRELLRTDADGGFMLGLTAGEQQPPGAAPGPGDEPHISRGWQIERLSLELSGVVAP
jgi:hypothetical protein